MALTKKIYPFILIIFFLSGQSAFCQANNGQSFFLYEDTAKKLTGETALEIYKQGNFSKTTAGELNMGFTRSVFWLAYLNEFDQPADSLLLNIGNQHINIIHVYFAQGSNINLQWLSGDYFPFNQRPVNTTNFYFPITKKGLYLARVDKSNESLQLSFEVIPRLKALTEEANAKIIMALFTGMILLMIIFGSYLFVISKDTVYLYYILYITSGWLWVLSNAGYGFQYLWPYLPWFASKARPVFALAPLIFSMLLLVKYIDGIKSKKVLLTVKLLNTILLTCIISILLFNEAGYQNKWWLYIQYFIPLISLSYAFVLFGILIAATLKRNKLAVFYLVAIMALLIFAVLQSSFSLGGLGGFGKFFNSYGMSVGYVIEAIILTAGLVYRFNQYRLDKEKLLIEMNRRQLENTRVLMEVQAAERSQVATQLHDVAGSLLSLIQLNLSGLHGKEMIQDVQTNTLLTKTEEAVDMVASMVRNLSHALSPVMLTKVGFKASLEKVISIVNASGKINVELIVIGFEKYNPTLNSYYTDLYSIAYELLNNIVKHSAAKNVLLQVTEHNDSFSLIAEDDGLGMKPEQLNNRQSMGISGIKSKIDFLKGSIAFDSNTPQGLIVTIEIPIANYDL